LDLAVDRKIITKEQQDEMWSENVLRWLGGDYADDLRKRLS
jgi:hypothetical protein